jgi:hypothetical protein
MTIRRFWLWLGITAVMSLTLWETYHGEVRAASIGGRPNPGVWPATLAVLTVVSALSTWEAREQGREGFGFYVLRSLVFVLSAISALIQVVTAPPTWAGWLTAAWTPAALYAAIEVGLWLVKQPKAEAPEPKPEPEQPPKPGRPPRPAVPAPSERPAIMPRLHAVPTRGPEQVTAALRAKLPADTTDPELIWSLLPPEDRAALSATVMQHLTGLSRATAARRLAALRERQAQAPASTPKEATQ